jgi:hypothetical protein
MDDNLDYMRWLERMWDANKLAHYRRIEREEKRMEEIRGIFEELEIFSSRRIQVPVFPASDDTPLW